MKGRSIARAIGLMLAVAWIATAGTVTAEAQEALPPFNRVEEDWVLVIDQPHLPAEGPQVTTTMSPKEALTGRFAVLNLNYRSHPSFRGGGSRFLRITAPRWWRARPSTRPSSIPPAKSSPGPSRWGSRRGR